MAIVAKFCPLKVLKLDFSSWYVNNLDAYNFLSKTVDQDRIFQSFDKGHEDKPEKVKESLRKYLTDIDTNYRLQNPIPGKKYIILSRDGEYKKRIFEYV